MKFAKVSCCPNCGTPIYNKTVLLASPKLDEEHVREASWDIVYDDDGLPKNFFTCNCRLPRILCETDKAEVRNMSKAYAYVQALFSGTTLGIPTVDIDKVHGDETPSLERLQVLKVKMSNSERMYQKVSAMDRLQELHKNGFIEISYFEKREVGDDFVRCSVVIKVGENIPEAILNIKIDDGKH